MAEEANDGELERWLADFDSRQNIFEDLRAEVVRDLETAITTVDKEREAADETRLFKVHDLRSRVKGRKSFRDKVLRKRYTDPLKNMLLVQPTSGTTCSRALTDAVATIEDMAMVAKTVSGTVGCGFFATLDCLGKTFASEIAGHRVTVSMPVLETKDDKVEIAAPSMTGIRLDNPIFESASLFWGRLFPLDKPVVARVGKLGITTEVRANDLLKSKTLREMVRASEQWWTAVSSWIEVLTGQQIKRIGPERRSAGGREGPLSILPTSTEETMTWFVREMMRPDVTGIAEPAQLHASFVLAGRGEMPPDDWLFIRDARSLFRAGEYRRAVMDVGSAAELAIMRLIENKLTKQGKSTVYIAKQVDKAAKCTLGGKKTLFETQLKLGKLPPNFQSIVIDKRNDAVHLKAEIRQIDAKRAIGKTHKLVEKAIPLSSLIPL